MSDISSHSGSLPEGEDVFRMEESSTAQSSSTLVRGGLSTVDPEVEQAIQAELEPGERLLWCSRANPSGLQLQSIPMVLFGIPWTVFALFWMESAFTIGHHPGMPGTFVDPMRNIFPLFGLPFVLIGIGLLSSPFWLSRSIRKTMYGISDRRAIIISGSWARTVQSFAPQQLTSIQHTVRANGAGDVVFSSALGIPGAYVNPSSGIGFSRPYAGSRYQAAPGFYSISDPRAVEALLRRLAQAANA